MLFHCRAVIVISCSCSYPLPDDDDDGARTVMIADGDDMSIMSNQPTATTVDGVVISSLSSAVLLNSISSRQWDALYR